ncbi:MAG: alanine racemase [Sutterellaceae bacterium]|nr:alanine racemase [Sutterellaceae bacterium]
MLISDLDTPSLILDLPKLRANIAFAKARCKELGVVWRPHVKTHKCLEIAHLQLDDPTGPITVSTVYEAEFFASHGVKDIIYAVGIAPHKLPELDNLNRAGADIKVVLDSVEAAQAVSKFCKAKETTIGVLIEIDCDGHRSGVKPADPVMVEIAKALTDGATFKGVLTHAGESYSATNIEEARVHAVGEVKAINTAKDLLAANGFVSEIVSVGSTPTLVASPSAVGVTEYRSGVGTFYDLVMAGVGVCNIDQIAVSVLVSVIGHQKDKGWVITDGGWLAMSRDRGTANQKVDCGYGLVCDVHGNLMPDLWVKQCNQEHGVVCRRDGAPLDPKDFPLDMKLRILPNHACPTAAAFSVYNVTDGADEVTAHWSRINGW